MMQSQTRAFLRLHRRALRVLATAIVALVAALSPARALADGAILRLWHGQRGDEEKALQQILARWKGPPVDVLAVPYDALGSKIAAAVPLGEGPDVYIDSHERVGDYRARGIVGPAGDALEPGAFAPYALAAVTDGGVAWAVPLTPKCLALYVNDDLAKGSPESLEAIADLAPSLPEGTFALAWQAGLAYAHAPLFAAFGGHMLEPGDAFGFVGPAAERSVLLAKGLVDRGVVPEDADGALVTDLFKNGRAAYAISGPWLAADLGGARHLRYHVESLPAVRAAGGARMRPLVTVESAVLSPKGAARPEARALVRLLASREAALVRRD
ncbi:MAG TPA: extracellular solute-binding protein, partial [Minicystis sp.]|nr:extracellular solute-binding protein [Minicystis sp.]